MSYTRRRWCVLFLAALAEVAMRSAQGATIKFDQSQTGDYNLQIHLKNIELYAVFDDSSTSDDDYSDLPDYSDLTENTSKPIASSTTKAPPPASAPVSAVVPSTTTTGVPDLFGPSNSEKIVQMVEALIASNGNTPDMPTDPSAAIATTTTTAAIATNSAAAPTSASTANRKCGPGYFRDPMGRCRRIRKPHLPFLQMVHTPGVIKSFQPQQRQSDDSTVTEQKN
ncbi:uncharacterized protein LOC126833882 [Adelges cooleyi]|uniref:uncharacterized protein LOC126833882 n=1 Tax=Adelges cooleyi TaxID=133065 RepID=UPI00217F997F|nr:uncharacterized protein LOC126833882 [Adelges cooleyi]